MAQEPALNLPNPWAAVGRDTEAGRALFALYNGFGHARSRGNDYSQVNRMKHLRYIATHRVPEFPVPRPLPPKKPEVKVPHFPHKNPYCDDYHPVDFIPRRRRASDILQQIRDDSYVAELPPMPKGPLLDEAEKTRLQEVFYWSNRNLGPEPPVAEPVRRLPKKGSVEEQELLLNEIAKEIEDREVFLNEMEEYGKGEQYRSQIMFEIQQRVGQMKLLHENITQQEKNENEVKKSETPTPRALYAMPPPKSHARGQGRTANSTALRSKAASPQDLRFERFSSHDETLGNRASSQREQTSPPDPWTTLCNHTREPSPPNVIKTVSCFTNEAAPQPPTPPPSTTFPTKKTLNLNLDLPSPPNSGRFSPAYTASPQISAARSVSSIRSDPRTRANTRVHQQSPQNGDTEAENYTSNGSNPASTTWNINSSDVRSPSSIASDPRNRAHCVRFQQSAGSMASNPNVNYPAGCTPWNLDSSGARAFPSDTRSHPQSGGSNVDPSVMSGMTSNSNGNYPSKSTPWHLECSNGSDVRSPSSISSDPRSRAHGVRFQHSGGASEFMTGVPSNSFPSGSTPCDGGCSPVDSPHDIAHDIVHDGDD